MSHPGAALFEARAQSRDYLTAFLGKYINLGTPQHALRPQPRLGLRPRLPALSTRSSPRIFSQILNQTIRSVTIAK